MKQHQLRPPRGAKKTRKRVGRGQGSGYGKTAGRGMSGQRSRSGHGIRPFFEGGQRPLVQRLPTKRGFSNIFRIAFSVVNVSRLGELFEPETVVTPHLLKERRVLRNLNRPVKILGDGDLEVPLHVFAHAFSSGALSKITAAGGSCTLLDPELVHAPPEAPEAPTESADGSEEEQA